jgi:hypothetical protein
MAKAVNAILWEAACSLRPESKPESLVIIGNNDARSREGSILSAVSMTAVINAEYSEGQSYQRSLLADHG